MAERKQQNWFIPLRVRLRSGNEPTRQERSVHHETNLARSRAAMTTFPPLNTSAERERFASRPQSAGPGPAVPATGSASATGTANPTTQEQALYTRQVKELIRLGNMLRAELGLEEVLQQIAASITACTGFRSAVIKLLQENSEYLKAVAFAGISSEDQRRLIEHPMRVEQMLRQMRPEFRISQSYFISHEHIHEFADVTLVGNMPLSDYQPGGWHPLDMLIVPLYSPRKKQLVGFISLDEPEDGQIPTLERIEILELFANQAAIAIDNAQVFAQQEAEHRALQEAIAALRAELEPLSRGDLRVRLQARHVSLEPVTEVLNTLIEHLHATVSDLQKSTRTLDDYAHGLQRSAELLVRDADQQERQVYHLSHEVDQLMTLIRQLGEHAARLTQMTSEALDVTAKGQETVDRAVEGIRQVREATMQSARLMKRLSESGQEINETVTAITDLTASMNLLALNAAIEAVRASEYGQGFAVIAQEIRTLAVRSAEAARKVATHIRTVQHETTAISQSVERNTQQVITQTDLVTQTGIELDAILTVAEQIADLADVIHVDTERQSKSSQLAVASVGEMSRMSTELNEHLQHSKQAVDAMVGLTEGLRRRLAPFKVQEEL
ncbi:methyl-accepting chemotaxis protein [Thermogemmatispora onikobensis]|uniref:methyl-accepting chemotaxis protein n=1 Tax=Thermogemmatispora onikobensis TaxID=732234 RepID=UPI000852B65C|nr:methyl-accepting chemotaxis protein [Thermogemmatispora onikobensis]